MKPTYSVRTWDSELGTFTPQNGVPSSGLSWLQLLHALRKLKSLGYTCHRTRGHDGCHNDSDCSVLVERED